LGIKFGLPYLHHWDEGYTALTALRMLKTGDFNPHFFQYPGFLIYTSLIIDILHYYYLMAQEAFAFDYLRIAIGGGVYPSLSHPSFYLWNRAFISLLGTGCVLLTYLILRKSFGKIEGLLGAFLLAGFSLHISHSRYITPNIPVCFFVLFTILFALKFHYSRKIKDIILSSIFVEP
jgi:4-amino-4-deoxy-L-arabinose transferase-like glycosyltransferase